ncbi:MAG: hypothetical protein PHQ66_01780 [Candidatus Nanoarchaeia archaeon]|nr:hypothetical protein [Candidatus Nanoarchaeia archaeon]MDD5357896.1 hypothetical protein [Candidatus Nanoarchaeia archaeon]MDD5588815.1 hypothetical protein [Candidatus Nanoarchaeia archaeon]
MVVKKKVVKTETIIKEDKPKTHVTVKRVYSPPKKRETGGTGVEKILVENFVSLQKVMTNMAVKFDSLSDQISKLLELFEISAKTLSEKGYSTGEDKKILAKLDSLLEHDKVIAKGIALLHEKSMPEEQEVIIMPAQQIQQPQMQMQPRQMPPPQRMIPPPQMRNMGTSPMSPQTEPPKTKFVQEA